MDSYRSSELPLAKRPFAMIRLLSSVNSRMSLEMWRLGVWLETSIVLARISAPLLELLEVLALVALCLAHVYRPLHYGRHVRLVQVDLRLEEVFESTVIRCAWLLWPRLIFVVFYEFDFFNCRGCCCHCCIAIRFSGLFFRLFYFWYFSYDIIVFR